MVSDFSIASELFSPLRLPCGSFRLFDLIPFVLCVSHFRSVLLPFDDLRLLHRYFDTLPDNCKSSYLFTYIYIYTLIHSFSILSQVRSREIFNLHLAHQNILHVFLNSFFTRCFPCALPVFLRAVGEVRTVDFS